MLSLYFHRHSKNRSGLQSYCKTCSIYNSRAKNLSENRKAYRREYTRKRKEQERRANGVKPRNTKLMSPRFRGKELKAYIERFITKRPRPMVEETQTRSAPMELYLNGVKLETSDRVYIERLGTEFERTNLDRVDALAIKYDLPLWEMQETAGCYKRDRRSTARLRRQKRSDGQGDKSEAV